VSSRVQRELSWVIPERIASMPRPGSDGPVDVDAAFLEKQGVSVVVMLTATALPVAPFTARGIAVIHIRVGDDTAPIEAQLEEFVAKASEAIQGGGRVAVHDASDQDQTGTFFAAYLVSTGMTAEDAISRVRRLRPGSIETVSQEDAVRAYDDVARACEALQRRLRLRLLSHRPWPRRISVRG